MKPFAHKPPQNTNYRKLMLMLLAGASLSIWYFDLIPHLVPIDTGHLDSDQNLNDDDFLALLETPSTDTVPDIDAIVDHKEPESTSGSDDDSLLAALASQAEPIENSFPEFASRTRPTETLADQQPTDSPKPAGIGIRQATFDQTEPEFVMQAVVPVVLSPELAAQLRNVDDWMDTGETLQAHAVLSRLYWKQPEVRPLIQARMEVTAAEIYANPKRHFAEPYVVQFGETLDGIAQQFHVPWQYLARLNGVTAQSLQAGQSLKVLKGPFGAVIDLSDFEMTVHAHGWYVRRYTIGIGSDQRTPTGDFTVQNKLENPKWYDPQGGVVEGDDPTNPLGEYWLGLGDHIGIHGTIDPDSIGRASSRGCIHLADADIAEVYQLLGVGSEVVIRD